MKRYTLNELAIGNFNEVTRFNAPALFISEGTNTLYFNTGGKILEISGTGEGNPPLANTIVCNQDNKETTLGGTIDSTKEYFIDGIIDMGTTQIVVPATGITLRGYSFDLSGLTSTEANYSMFISATTGGDGGGSGNMLGFDYFIDVSGTGSKVYDIYDETGFNAFEFQRINYLNCISLGDIHNYRQGLETGTGRFGGSPSLTLHGTWVGGFRITTSIVRSLSVGMTEPLFKAGTAFQMQSRFLSDINVDLPTSAALLDFVPANFPNPSTLQLKGCEVTRDEVYDSTDSNLTPNITAGSLASDWADNNGLSNTFVGGALELTTEVLTTVTLQNTAYVLNGTFAASDLQHFDSPSNGQLRHLGNTPKDYIVNYSFVLEGVSLAQYEISLIKDSGGVETVINTQTREVANLAGARDVAYFNSNFRVTLIQNDFVFWKVTNKTGTGDCTLEIDSDWSVEKR
tara:strand:+ start:3905 stop:5278 length:1374 start_codon:yes stop_codon:yes gene_type:complete